MGGLISLVANDVKSNWGISIPQWTWTTLHSCFRLWRGYLQIMPVPMPGSWILCHPNHAAASAETGWLQARQEMNGDNDRSAWCMSAIGACSYPHHASWATAFISMAEKCRFLYCQLGILWLWLLHRLQFYWTMRPLSWLTAELHHFWTDPLMGDAGGPHLWSWSEIVTILIEQRCTVVVLLEVSRWCNWKTISDRSVLQNLPLCWVQDLGGSRVHTNAHTTKDREQNKAIGHLIVVVVCLYHVPFH